jgi:tight adherence protein B
MVAFSLLVAALLGFALWALLRPAPRTVQRRVAEFVSLYTPAERAKRARVQPAQRTSVVDDSGQRRSLWRKFCENVEIADVALTPRQILVGTVAATIFAMFLFAALLGSPVFAIFGLGTPILVYNTVSSRAARRRRIFGEQLPDTLQILASAVRAGHTLVGALAVVADEAPEPTRGEMRRVAADEQFGIPLAQALGRVATRMQNTELEQVAIVADLQRDAGGNIADVLEGVADTVRERLELRQLVRSLTAQGRLSRWLLTLLPPSLALIVAFIDPGYLDPLFHTASGQAILVMAGIMILIGSLAIKRIVEIKV